MATLWLDIDVTPTWWPKTSQDRAGRAIATALVKISDERDLRMSEVRASAREIIFRVGCIYLTDEDMHRALPLITKVRDDIRKSLEAIEEITKESPKASRPSSLPPTKSYYCCIYQGCDAPVVDGTPFCAQHARTP